MRMLLVFTAGVALLSAPAFAQSDQSAMQPAPGVTQTPPDAPTQPSDQMQQPGVTDQNQPGVTPPPPAPNQPGPPPAPGVTNEPGVTTGPTQSQSRLYQSEPAVSGQNVQVITNGPVPDTRLNRARFRPLSHAGRATRPRGN